ncbi:UTP--glucose-1-phosphate uridylyltransferase [Alloalcanivorax gelatiniphagus]|uniref:UTP--glucose-1-phosphate uridylyltransferase n=1 Tax=Alloalcanivorax gelatiniphagus TaxID=1194167 RepID=A0ABY2XMB6_9GAMM|nr:UTP--glucose-1-phosphate uridylyltransferase [Alloalcanivorax gelatiniphagus]TMW13432.1 UTP--glucose-1-phosphate uridylyltransferase [Alloalcanivorax gelatiniphagus]|tara:strand:+ start:24720 stop:25604 length:885 start_codon:yes stop_codon:yes gene_type:complete
MVRKAVIPVAGFGTRMLPASKSIPKEMLPIIDRPAIDYVVEEAVQAGITEIILVSHGSKTAIENFFDGHPELEAQLEAKGKTELLEKVRHPLPDGVQVTSVRQGPPQGLGHAVWQARQVVGGEPFVVILPDVLVDGEGRGNDLSNMIRRFQENGAAQIMVEGVPDELVHKYGIADLDGEPPRAGDSAPMRGVVEKPDRDQAPSNLSVVGRYVLPPEVMDLLAETPPGAGGEIQLTDAIAALIGRAPVEAYAMLGRTFDCGSKEGYLQAILHYAVKHPEIGDAARDLISRADRQE